jgi:hypothetical protein
MKGRAFIVLIALGTALAVCYVRTSRASPSECQEAITDYKSARSDISNALQLYANCVSSGDGHDDCSSEFHTLQSAQNDFEDAVSRYESECN